MRDVVNSAPSESLKPDMRHSGPSVEDSDAGHFYTETAVKYCINDCFFS